ncbi:hypothetical protein H0H93_013241 [Arthromyces matolae]|nr:hypothetical protein H0H93_013241 [Arthromyces matolae]
MSLYPLALSYSGQKFALCKFQVQPTKSTDRFDGSFSTWRTGFGNQASCFIVEDQRLVDLHTPHPIYISTSMLTQFSSDEETIVSLIEECYPTNSGPRPPAIIGIWKLIKDSQGHYTHASFAYHYKEWSLFTSFCLVPATPNEPDIVFVASLGVIKQRALNKTWSDDENEEFLYQEPKNRRKSVELNLQHKTITVKAVTNARRNVTETLITACSNEKTSVSLMKWSFKSLPQYNIVNETCTLDAPYDTVTSWRSKYFVAGDALVQAFDGDKALEQNEQTWISLADDKGHIKATAFSAVDGDRVVSLQYNDHESNATLTMNDIRDGSLSLIATSTVEIPDSNKKLHFYLNINPVNSSHFLLTILIGDAAADDEDDAMGQEFRVILFELSAHQLVSTEIQLWNESDDDGTKNVGDEDEHVLHPVVMEVREPYIHNHTLFLFEDFGFFIKLYRRFLTPAGDLKSIKLSRIICMLPKNAKKVDDRRSFLIWPQDDEQEVTVIMAGTSGNLFVIETGIQSKDLLVEDAWVDDRKHEEWMVYPDDSDSV